MMEKLNPFKKDFTDKLESLAKAMIKGCDSLKEKDYAKMMELARQLEQSSGHEVKEALLNLTLETLNSCGIELPINKENKK